MAVKRFLGGAPLVAQVTDYILAGTWNSADLITFTVGSKQYVITTGTATITAILDAMIAAWAALDETVYPEFAEATATENGVTRFTLTVQGDHVGKPITCTISTNSGAGTIDAGASSAGVVSTANSGPHDAGVARNYSDFALPGNGDTVFFDDPDSEVKYSLSALAAITTLTIHVPSTARIGLPPVNTDSTAYPEYRPLYAVFAGCTLVNIGARDGSGSSRVQFDFGSAAVTACNVFGSGTGETNGLEAVLLKATHAAAAWNVSGGQVGFAVLGAEVATLGTLTQLGGQVRCGAGVTNTTIVKYGGTLTLSSAVGTSLSNFGGDVTINGTGAVAALVARGAGTVAYNSTGTLGGAPEVSDGAVLTFDGDPRAKAVTNPIDVHNGGRVIDNNKVVATLVIDFNSMDPGWGVGKNLRVTRGAVA